MQRDDTPNLVCDDYFGTLEAQSACYTLGYTNGGSFESSYAMTEWSEPEIPFLMDDVQCESASTSFLSCSTRVPDCSHSGNVLLTCFASGKESFKKLIFYYCLNITSKRFILL